MQRLLLANRGSALRIIRAVTEGRLGNGGGVFRGRRELTHVGGGPRCQFGFAAAAESYLDPNIIRGGTCVGCTRCIRAMVSVRGADFPLPATRRRFIRWSMPDALT